MGPNELVTISLERRRWEQLLVGLDCYVNLLRGDRGDMSDDPEWVNQLAGLADDLRSVVGRNGIDEGNHLAQPANPANPTVGLAENLVDYDGSAMTDAKGQSASTWSKEENEAIVTAYFWLLEETEAGHDVNKAAVYRDLKSGILHRRSLKSIERKMQNVSAVLNKHGITFVQGLKPLSNYQFDLGVIVEEQLANYGMIDRDGLDARA